MVISLEQLNHASPMEAGEGLDGLYEHSPWVVQQALHQRPFKSLAHLKHVLCSVVSAAPLADQLALIRAHPELAGKAMIDERLTAESSGEQQQAGLTHCSADEFARLQALNTAYNARFGFPFILAVRGPRGTGLSRQDILQAFERRLHGHPDTERQECLRQIHRIAELRLNDKLGCTPTQGHQVWDWHEDLARYSEPEALAKNQLTVTYLTPAHQACAALLQTQMRACGFDEVALDAVGNVVGRYLGHDPSAPSLLTGSHYDTVRNAGKYDGRLGIYVPMACVRALSERGQRLPFTLEVVAFSEEEGQRFNATFLSASALIGQFAPRWLDQTDAQGITLREAMLQAGLNPDDMAALQRNPADYLGYVEVHIEQGPVLNELNLPLGIVTGINASARYRGEMVGTACHAGTTPMALRSDAAVAVAELLLVTERRAKQDANSVATMGHLWVPGGSVNVVPGRCEFSLDLRAPSNAQRDALERDVVAALQGICDRRGVQCTLQETLRAAAAPSAPAWQHRWEEAVASLGLPLHRLPSGAGHDAMKLHELLPQAMLFVRGEHHGISHNPLESTTSCDMQLAVDAFSALLTQLATDLNTPT